MTRRTLYVQLIIAFMCVAMVAYLVMLGRVAVAMIGSGRAAAAGLGLALLILPVIGLWAMIATLRAGFAYQRLARLIAEDGLDIDASALPAGLLAAFSETRPMRCSLPCAPSSKTTPTTGAAGTDWRAPTTTRGIGAARGKR
ncbi:transmembrane protein [Mycobacterium tuberculosis]|nr:transmembrane protein [Mycobacterium tuberculosis]